MVHICFKYFAWSLRRLVYYISYPEFFMYRALTYYITNLLRINLHLDNLWCIFSNFLTKATVITIAPTVNRIGAMAFYNTGVEHFPPCCSRLSFIVYVCVTYISLFITYIFCIGLFNSDTPVILNVKFSILIDILHSPSHSHLIF